MFARTLTAYSAHRSQSGPLPVGAAPFTSSDFFKLKQDSGKVCQRSWDTHLSLEGKSRNGSVLKSASRGNDLESVISLGTGRPAAQYYPWQSVKIDSVDTLASKSNNCLATTEKTCVKGDMTYDLGIALNYGYAAGSPQVLRFITEHIEMIHRPPYGNWNVALTCGTTSAIEILLRLLCDRGDTILCEQYTYPGTSAAAKGVDVKLVGIEMDDSGMIPQNLESKLRDWDVSTGPRPRILYTIPSGQNPTSTTQTEARRNSIYKIAEQFDLIIIEDDPYYFLQLSEGNDADLSREGEMLDRYVAHLRRSYLSLDVSGRVVRLDSTSKILAPGLRCGWITGCDHIVQKFVDHTELSTVSPSGPTQVLLHKLLEEAWGHIGFLKWLMYLSSQYRSNAATLIEMCHAFLPSDICSWTSPSVGMFLWVRVNWTQHPLVKANMSERHSPEVALTIEDKIYRRAKECGVLVCRGSWFAVEHMVPKVFFRLTFAAVTGESIRLAVKRLGKAICEEFEILDNDKIYCGTGVLP